MKLFRKIKSMFWKNEKALNEISVQEIIEELIRRELVNENTRIFKNVLKNAEAGHPINFILTNGKPQEENECSHCKKMLPSSEFTYYHNRVAESGFHSRSNALCHSCSKELNDQRQEVFKNSEIPPKPEKGACCPECKRNWNGKWHKHHVGEKFVAWICANCNMSHGDRRNPHRLVTAIPQ